MEDSHDRREREWLAEQRPGTRLNPDYQWAARRDCPFDRDGRSAADVAATLSTEDLTRWARVFGMGSLAVACRAEIKRREPESGAP